MLSVSAWNGSSMLFFKLNSFSWVDIFFFEDFRYCKNIKIYCERVDFCKFGFFNLGMISLTCFTCCTRYDDRLCNTEVGKGSRVHLVLDWLSSISIMVIDCRSKAEKVWVVIIE